MSRLSTPFDPAQGDHDYGGLSRANPVRASRPRRTVVVHRHQPTLSTGSCGAMVTPRWNCVIAAMLDYIWPPFRPYWAAPLLSVGLGVRVGDAICLPSAVPELRTSTLKQIVFVLTQPWFPPRLFATVFGCLRPLSEEPCLRLALSPRLSPKIPNLQPAVDTHLFSEIEQHHSSRTGVSRM